MARKSKYTPETVELITQGILLGLTMEQCAKRGGIHYDTFNEWRKSKAEFSEAIEKAEAEAVTRKLARIDKAGKEGHWQADAWWLERRHPQEWGRRVLELQGKDGKDLYADTPTDQLIRALAAILDKAGARNGRGDNQ